MVEHHNTNGVTRPENNRIREIRRCPSQSITAVDICKALKDEGFDIEKSSIVMDNLIKTLGIYEVPIQLHPEVEAKLKVWVVKKQNA